MPETFLALLIAHLLADFVFQTNAMVRNKRHPGMFSAHLVLVGLTTLATLGGAWLPALAITLLHALIDALKTYALPARQRARLWAFFLDQSAHGATLLWAASLWPAAFAQGMWADAAPDLIAPGILIAGFLVATAMGGPVVGGLMRRFPQSFTIRGLQNAGRMIGLLERAFVFFLILFDSPLGIGFLLTAKSVLRFDTTRKGQRASEYVIIGTLASFGWAMAAAFFTKQAFLLITP